MYINHDVGSYWVSYTMYVYCISNRIRCIRMAIIKQEDDYDYYTSAILIHLLADIAMVFFIGLLILYIYGMTMDILG